jgi:hypothetical protein
VSIEQLLDNKIASRGKISDDEPKESRNAQELIAMEHKSVRVCIVRSIADNGINFLSRVIGSLYMIEVLLLEGVSIVHVDRVQ